MVSTQSIGRLTIYRDSSGVKTQIAVVHGVHPDDVFLIFRKYVRHYLKHNRKSTVFSYHGFSYIYVCRFS